MAVSRGRVALLLWAMTMGLLALARAPARAGFPVPQGTEFSWQSGDESLIELTGPASVTFPVVNKKGELVGNQVFAAGPGGMLKFQDHKSKSGKWTVTGISGDPLATLVGPITDGSGTIDISAQGIPGLFPTSTAHLTFLSGSMMAGITLPGDQLTGPDGANTYIQYTSTWSSMDPIGTFNNGTEDLDVVLGQITLNSFGRPSSFSYDMAPDVSGNVSFTTGEAMGLSSGQTLNGTVTKQMRYRIIPEPSSLLLLSSAAMMLTALRRRLCRPAR